MKIVSARIENFRSLKLLEQSFSVKLNAFVGENSAGKSNIFDAINLLLGPTYPSFNSIRGEDHFAGDTNNKISIKVTFDDGKYLEFAEVWTDRYGNQKSGVNLSGGYCTDELRRKYCSAYVGTTRQVTDYLPSSKWTLMGRLLQEINERFTSETVANSTTLKSTQLVTELNRIRDELLFTVTDENDQNIMQSFLSILRAESAKQLNCSEADFSINFNLYDPWNFYKTMQIMVKEKGSEMEFHASELGMGFQASLTIAILKAYAQLKLRNQPPIFIDEPELFLHPHAQRSFYNLLRELAESGTQVFYTTHSPNFLSVGHFNETFIVRKTVRGTYIRGANPQDFVADTLKRTGNKISIQDVLLQYQNAYENTGNSKAAAEAFFAKKIVLVEGQSESLLVPYYMEKLGFDHIQNGISVVCCGSKSEICRFLRLYSEFGIPCYVVFDGDRQHASTQAEPITVRKNKEILKLVDVAATCDYPDGAAKETYLGFEKTINDNLGFPCVKKGLELYQEARNQHENNGVPIPAWANEIVIKMQQPSSEASSLLER